MQKMKITEEDLLTILNEYYTRMWEYVGYADTRIVGISKAINEDGNYVYDLTLEGSPL